MTGIFLRYIFILLFTFFWYSLNAKLRWGMKENISTTTKFVQNLIIYKNLASKVTVTFFMNSLEFFFFKKLFHVLCWKMYLNTLYFWNYVQFPFSTLSLNIKHQSVHIAFHICIFFAHRSISMAEFTCHLNGSVMT